MDYSSIQSLSQDLGLPVSEEAEFRDKLADAINYMVQHDFSRLVQVLYRRDISESKLKEMITLNKVQGTGLIIADLLIEREKQKAESRKRFRRDNDIPEDEKW